MTAPRLRFGDRLRVASVGVRNRPLRSALSALGIAIGVAAIVAVLGLSASSQAGLLAEIDRLGTNLLTATNGQSFTGQSAQLPLDAPARISHLASVEQIAHTGEVPDAHVYRSPLVPSINTNALQVQAADLDLLSVIATSTAQGRWLNSATATQPVAVLGADAAERLGVSRVYPGERIWLGGQWFYVAGILNPAVLANEIDSSVLVGYPAAQEYLGYHTLVHGKPTVGPPSKIYVRAQTDNVPAVHSVLAQTANPEAPNEVDVSRPSDALTARAKTEGAFNNLFLGLGAVALVVGAVGVANIMIIAVLERRSEIGLRRALGATRGQFLSESIILSLAGGAAGIATGSLATIVYASSKHWSVVIPPFAWVGGIGAALTIGAVAGLIPATKAAKLSPTEALRTA